MQQVVKTTSTNWAEAGTKVTRVDDGLDKKKKKIGGLDDSKVQRLEEGACTKAGLRFLR